jgi:hypothetical protein
MTASPFDTPDAGGDLFVNAEHVGDLLVIRVHGTENGVQTENGLADVIRADITVVNPDGSTVEHYVDTMIFGRVIYGQLKQKAGRTVLGVWRGEPGVKRNGKSVPYTLDPATPEQTEIAVRAMTAAPEPAERVQQGAAAPAPAPRADPWAKDDEPPF